MEQGRNKAGREPQRVKRITAFWASGEAAPHPFAFKMGGGLKLRSVRSVGHAVKTTFERRVIHSYKQLMHIIQTTDY